jgi:peroxiredoxin
MTVLFGVPDCGKVCSEQHVPGYLKHSDALRKLGVSQVLCVAVGDAEAAQAWGAKVGADGGRVTVAADTKGALTRLLGLDLGEPDAAGPRSLRYAAVIEDGILLRLRVDATPAEAKESSAEAVAKVIKALKA